ncbi:NADH-quinone oxidoreductase subunit G [Dyadobacter sp. BE34]|uniref:NADH-quinone oxidoreductase subunit G n=1 Tax=Dyadobacter fermentans TaxID=94254 RepID=A0ABU1R017_9BACT|nr:MULTISPECIES: NADH-quinone oxidoreductase subunit NuoG [Dyadobacter]MDR6806752.1 NADH-quinone oxidoreductase subunit G [Dyadobacter fermentans]MDR7044494.1 NADH-quinone oxidoreductase subunit G [Dyadobacter sp. BE242]MDR7198804.1 NADH-quinone oxidoreductase subunit G [Dyadobacter sp. BE34]MDR7216766.1 NADH-quinone oxidoreductase subunit G [Dyadobacter sp. BE31]MDR7263708.1 NADH-quinone oxidoreductase subunit G [Dyadobacter sp. BE32]
MVRIYIDQKPYDVKPGKNLLETCLTLGLDLPYFCWHPAMGSVGACRQCAVKLFKDENDKTGRLVMACMEGVRDNMYLSVNDTAAHDFRSQNIEWLMSNHPHDCAVCDEGGSCHLQDMTVMTGHAYRRFRFPKRTYQNQYLGPFLHHEMNRCIQCYRCVRFYKDYAGGKDLDVFAAHNHVYFGREKDGVLENEFSGNLAEVCPTGVFTDKTLREHYTRKWDMTMAPSVCQHCSLGCNIIAGERYGALRQITNRFNGAVNGYFICDRGRYGYEFVNDPGRVRQPVVRSEKEGRNLFQSLSGILTEGILIGIGSPRASLEANFALRRLVGEANFYQGIPENEAMLLRKILAIQHSGHVYTPSLKETEYADVTLVLGEDPTNSAPRLSLALRQAVRTKPLENIAGANIPLWNDAAVREMIQDEKGELFMAYPVNTKLDEIASGTLHAAPEDIARFGFAIAHYIDNSAPEPQEMDAGTLESARRMADLLQKAERPLIVSGTSLFNEDIIQAAYQIGQALEKGEKKAALCFVMPECNSAGLAMMQAPSLAMAMKAAETGNFATAVILENDLYRRAKRSEVDRFLGAFNNTIVLDHLENDTARMATVLIPTATFAEGEGTLVNNEERAQRFFQVFMPKNEHIRESWRWLDEFRQFRDGTKPDQLRELDNLLEELVRAMPQFKGAEMAAPLSDFRINGQRIPREPHRFSGRTAMLANVAVSEPKPPEDTDSPLSFTMEGYRGMPPAPLTPFYWSPGWNSGQSVHKYQSEAGGPLRGGDPGVRLLGEIQHFSNGFQSAIPPAFERQGNEMVLVPLRHIFGSEELSVLSPSVEGRAPRPYIALNSLDAERLHTAEGAILRMRIGDQDFDLPVILKNELPEGLAGLPYNLPSMSGIPWPAKGVLTNTTS